MAELSARAASCVSFVDGQAPVFDFATVRSQAAEVREELVCLEAGVARANATATVAWQGRNLVVAEAIRRLQEMRGEISWLSSLSIREGVETVSEHDYDDAGRVARRNREIRHVSRLSEANRVAEIERLREGFASLNDVVEAANHTTRLP